jgi:phosphatidylserine/phosphatidylglycerophosphate/cardiolipin synthase-like enzyme
LKLLVQPGDGVIPLVEGIESAKKSIEIVIFRFDRGEMERALKAAVERGVFVHALVAHTNRGGEKSLRKIEMRFLDYGITVARTATSLVRFHDKLMIVDRRVLYLMGFNLSYLDVEHSRSFGIITGNRRLVHEAAKLFEADTERKPYLAGLNDFVVSPVNARTQLSAFIRRARKQLLIYDPKISDPSMIRLLQDRARAGVEIKLIGRLTHKDIKVEVRKLSGLRLHTRTMIRDGRAAFIGSQSLREIELDSRREVGIILRDAKVVNHLVKTFEGDWAEADKPTRKVEDDRMTVGKAAKMVVKTITRELPPVAPVVQEAVKEVVGEKVKIELNVKEVEETVKEAVKEAVTEVVRDAVSEVVDEKENKNHK